MLQPVNILYGHEIWFYCLTTNEINLLHDSDIQYPYSVIRKIHTRDRLHSKKVFRRAWHSLGTLPCFKHSRGVFLSWIVIRGAFETNNFLFVIKMMHIRSYSNHFPIDTFSNLLGHRHMKWCQPVVHHQFRKRSWLDLALFGF